MTGFGVALPASDDDETVIDALERYRDAGATDIVATQTGLHTADDRRRTWALLARLHKRKFVTDR